jgi:serine/threonine protein kinase/tetratricopeptide (TPR) repeat protein
LPKREDANIDEASQPGLSVPGGELAPGEKFADRYLVDALIGRGGMGTVYRVNDTMVDEVVALKLLGIASADVVERFRREVRLARRITSPHVARTHDLGSQDGCHYLTMELIEGTSLSRKLDQHGPFSPARTARTAAAIARGLAAAHAASVVHRDLKPDNVLIENGGRVVVTDFGIARALEGDNTRMTNGIAGTPAYMAPEQLVGAKVDARTDLYALGVVMFELLTGELPFVGDTPIAIAVQRLHQPPRDLASLRELPAKLVELVTQLLARDPNGRPPDATSLAARLDELAVELDTGTPPSISLGTASSLGSISASMMSTPPLGPSTGTPSSGSLPRVIAVLPLTYRGPAEADYLADGIADELVDLVSRTRGLSAIGRTSAADVASKEKDPRAIGRELRATHVLDGTIQASPTKVRLVTRLFDVESGVQVWTDRQESEIEGGLDEAGFAVQERLARRSAEALRLGLEGIVGSTRMSPEALELFTRARKQVRSISGTDRESVVETLERLLQLAPNFAPAYALHALACVRAWTTPREGKTRDWEAEARASVKRALERAAHVPESHHATAVTAMQDGRFKDAARHERAALALAPAYPEAHLLIGQLKVEAGQPREGIEALERAHDIDPTLIGALWEQARWNGLYGDLALYEKLLGRIGREPNEVFVWATLELRVGSFRDQPERIRGALAALTGNPHPVAMPMMMYGRTILREIPRPPLFSGNDAMGVTSARVRSMVMQMTAEVFGSLGETVECGRCVAAAADSILVDLDWMDRCPHLAEVRKLPEFLDWRRKVVLRCEDIWNG